MDLFSVITLIGGLAFFLYGMNVLSAGLERIAGGRLENALKKMTSNRFKCLALGAGITAAIQSSSAVTVMLVGLVNSGIMTLRQSIGVIMGSNIGTTMTAWILTLVGIESGNVFVKLLKPENFSLLFAFVGILMMMASKKQRRRDVGSILIGFAILMYGMKLMSGAVKPLAEIPEFTQLFTAFRNPVLGVLVGLLVTAVIQSSSASVGILQALALTGAVSTGAAIPIIMGQNIGTCVTALISSIGVNRNARKVAVVHVAFNLIGTTVCLILYCVVNALFRPAFVNAPIDAVGIAVIHTSFNLLTTALLLPFTGLLEALANRLLPAHDKAEKGTAELLDKRLLATPSFAIAECSSLSKQMAEIARNAVDNAVSLLSNYNEKVCDSVLEDENTLDHYEDVLGSFLVQLSAKKLSEEDSLTVSRILHAIGDFERLGDHAVNILHSSRELHEKGLDFSENARREIGVLTDAMREILSITLEAYLANDIDIAATVEPLEQNIDRLVEEIKSSHIKRLQKGLCSIELGFILSDVMTDVERVSDHCSNIAVAILELAHSTFDTHKALQTLRADDEDYRDTYRQYALKYRL